MECMRLGVSLLLVLLLCGGCGDDKLQNTDQSNSLELDTVENIEAYFLEYEDLFEQARKLSEDLTPEYAIEFYYDLDNVLQVSDNGQTLDIQSNPILKELETVLRNISFVRLTIYSNNISFLIANVSDSEYASEQLGVSYHETAPDKTERKIKDNWYSFHMALA